MQTPPSAQFTVGLGTRKAAFVYEKQWTQFVAWPSGVWRRHWLEISFKATFFYRACRRRQQPPCSRLPKQNRRGQPDVNCRPSPCRRRKEDADALLVRRSRLVKETSRNILHRFQLSAYGESKLPTDKKNKFAYFERKQNDRDVHVQWATLLARTSALWRVSLWQVVGGHQTLLHIGESLELAHFITPAVLITSFQSYK